MPGPTAPKDGQATDLAAKHRPVGERAEQLAPEQLAPEVGEVGIDVDVGVEAIVWLGVDLEPSSWIEVVVVEFQLRRRSCRRTLWPVSGQAEVAQDVSAPAGSAAPGGGATRAARGRARCVRPAEP